MNEFHHIKSGLLNWRFNSAGILHSVTAREFGSSQTVIVPEGACGFRLLLGDGRICKPGPGSPPLYRKSGKTARIEFYRLGWMDQFGRPVPSLTISLCYEINRDGVLFCDTMLHYKTPAPPEVTAFEFTNGADFSTFDAVRHAIMPQYSPDPRLIQSSAPERFLSPGGERAFAGEITRDGLVASGHTSVENRLLPGDVSPPVALHELLPSGRHRLAIRTIHMGEPFYSFITLKLFSSPDIPAEVLEFHNELEPDRAYLNWEIILL